MFEAEGAGLFMHVIDLQVLKFVRLKLLKTVKKTSHGRSAKNGSDITIIRGLNVIDEYRILETFFGDGDARKENA